ESKGWFKTKIYYKTSISSGAGLKQGDPVKLMGFDVGEITSIVPNDPYAYYNITVEFMIEEPNYGYLWSDSTAKVNAGDLLGNRFLEVTKGKGGVPTVHETTNKVADGILRWQYVQQREKELAKVYTNHTDVLEALKAEAAKNPSVYYTNAFNAETSCWLEPEES